METIIAKKLILQQQQNNNNKTKTTTKQQNNKTTTRRMKIGDHNSQESHTPAANQLSPPHLLGSGSRRIAHSSKSCNRLELENYFKLILGTCQCLSQTGIDEAQGSWMNFKTTSANPTNAKNTNTGSNAAHSKAKSDKSECDLMDCILLIKLDLQEHLAI